jgi:hypothetical protein
MKYPADIKAQIVVRKLTDMDDLLPWKWKHFSGSEFFSL